MIIIYDSEEIKEAIEYQVFVGQYKKLNSSSTFKADLRKVVVLLRQVSRAEELKMYGKLHYEKMKYDYSGKSSVRIGFKTKYRLVFEEFDGGIKINVIEISEHYGDK